MALQKRDIPNALTLLRLALAALTITLLSLWRPAPASAAAAGADPSWGIDWLLLIAAICFITAAITDALDGYLARKWSAISIFGRIMDPFADKILVLGALVAMASGAFTGLDPQGQPRPALAPLAGFTGWMVTLILARELLVTSIRGVYEARGIDFSATASGKAKMMLQSGAIPAILIMLALSAGAPTKVWSGVIIALAWLTTLVTLWSAVPYITKAMRTREAPGSPSLRGGPGAPPAPDSPAPGESPLNDPESLLPGGPPPPAERGATQKPDAHPRRDGGGTP